MAPGNISIRRRHWILIALVLSCIERPIPLRAHELRNESASITPTTGEASDNLPGRLILKLRWDPPPSLVKEIRGDTRLEHLFRDLGVESFQPLFDPRFPGSLPDHELSPSKLRRRRWFREALSRRGFYRYFVLTFPTTTEIGPIAEALTRLEEVESATPEGRGRLRPVPEEKELWTGIEDECFGEQWNLHSTKAGIDAPGAWAVSRGANEEGGVIIAVIDSGIDLHHGDIEGKIIGPTSVLSTDPDPQDFCGHGTRVAGIAAAKTDNGYAIAGVCPACRIMPVKIVSECDDRITSANVANALRYAFDNGADVINMSFLIEDPVTAGLVDLIIEGSVPLVAGIGNAGINSWRFPASFPQVIAVGATDRDNKRWMDSDWGLQLDFLAPGADVLSILPGTTCDMASGTSLSTPHVAGVIGLLLGKRSLPVREVRQILEMTADLEVCPNVTFTPITPELYIGHGKVHAFHALTTVAFDDVNLNDWFHKYVTYARQQNVIEGFASGSVHTFRPADPTSRAEVLKMAYNAAAEALVLPAPDPGFADVLRTDWFYTYVADAKSKGYVEGRPCGAAMCFFPNEAVNRAEAVKIIAELFKVVPEAINVHPPHIISFPDVPADAWFYPYVHWMANSELRADVLPNLIESPERLIRGYPDKHFRPGNLVNRAEMAKIVVNTMLYLRHGLNPQNCASSTAASSAVIETTPSTTSIGFLYEQPIDPNNLNAPAPVELPGGNEHIITGPFPFDNLDLRDADGDTLFYYWQASGGSFSTSDPVNFTRVTWIPPGVTEDTIFTVHVVRGDRRGLVGRGTFRFLVPGSASSNPASGTITSPNGTQTGAVTVSATASDADSLARVTATFISGGPELVLCGPDGPAYCSGTSGTWSRSNVDPAAFGATAGTVTLRLFVEDAAGEVLLVDSHAFTFSPPSSGPTFKLTVRKEGDGSGTVSGGGLVCGPGCTITSLNLPAGSSVTLTGAAAAGSLFVGFAGGCYGPDPCTLAMNRDITIYAAFGLPDAFGIRFTTPSNGDTGVAVSSQVNVHFNRDIAAGPNLAGIGFRESGGTPVPFAPVIRSTDRRLVLIPSSNLASGKGYIVDIPAGAIADTQGTPLAVPYSFAFTTAVAGTPKIYIAAYPTPVMEGNLTKVSVWFETPATQDRTITLTSTPPGELIHPSEVILEAGEVLVELQMDSRLNHGSTSPVTVTLSASEATAGQQSVPIVIANISSVTGASLKYQAAGVVQDDDQDGVFEAGEFADIRFEVANFGSSTISNVVLEFSVLNTPRLFIVGGAPFTCDLGSIAAGRSVNCTETFRADGELPTGDYYIQVKGTSSANGFLDQARVRIVNNAQPDFVLVAGTFPSAELQPGSTVDMRYTARNNADGFSEALPLFEITMEIEGTERLLYRTHADGRGYLSNAQSFRLPLVVPPVPGAHTIRARINPPGPGQLAESNFANNDAAVLTLRVAAPNQPPVLDPIPPALAAQVGRTLTFTARATDPNNDSITYRLAADAPAGATIGSASGVFTWTPACGQGPASPAISVIADDGKGGTDTETVTIDVGLEADLELTQTAGSELAVPGEAVGFTLVASNHGPSCVAGATVADAFPAGLTNVSWTCTASTGSSCTAGGTGGLGDASVSLASGGTVTYTITARVADTASGLVLNTATVTVPADVTDPNGTNNGASATITLRGLDFGDAPGMAQGPPWAFPTRLAENGARHGVYPDRRLGATLDAETDGQPSPAASGDDVLGARDEDGVAFPAQLVPCQIVGVQVTASAPGLLDAWIDFNTDGDWADSGERIAASLALLAGVNLVDVQVPCDATPAGTAFARFRLSGTGNLGPAGLALDGEVEDHAVTIAQVFHRLMVTRAGNGMGTVTASPGGINCEPDCSEDYPTGTAVILAAGAAPGSVFTGWTGGGCSGTGLCTVTMSAAKEVIANFNLLSTCEDRLEAGMGNWLAGRGPLDGGAGTGWFLTSTASHSPVRSLAIAGEARVKDQLLMTQFSAVPGDGSVELRFWHRVSLPDLFTGGVLEYSVNGGATWSDILESASGVPSNSGRFLAGGYNSALGVCCSNPLAGRTAWSGDNGGWQEVVVDLADFAGRPVFFRWRFASGSVVDGGSWWIDDVAFTGTGACPFVSLFEDGFESGGFSAWSGKIP